MSACLIEPHYLPSMAYFKLIEEYDTVYLDLQSKFIKQTYRNRCLVLLSNKIGQLVIPIQHRTLGGTLAEVKIDYAENWSAVHWKTIKSAYGKSPYFEHYAPYFERVYANPPEYLVDFLLSQMKLCFKFLGWKKELILVKDTKELPTVVHLKNKVHSKKSKFEFSSETYHQSFGETFVSNLSLVDLVFNLGPEATGIIRASELCVNDEKK